MGEGLGELAYRLRFRRGVVENQISAAFPEQNGEWVSATARASFRHVGREWLTVPYFTRRGLGEIDRRIVEFEGGDEYRAAYEEGRGVVVVSAHFGNWELAGSVLAAFGYPTDAVMQRLSNPGLNRFVKDLRNRNGMGLIDRAAAWDRLRASIAAKRVVAFVADQDARHRGLFVPFLGQPASTHKGPAVLALRTGAPFFVGGVHRVAPQQYHGWLIRLDPGQGADLGEQVMDLTRRWIGEVERRVRLYPEQYFWHHRRWKTKPPGTDPDGPGTRE